MAEEFERVMSSIERSCLSGSKREKCKARKTLAAVNHGYVNNDFTTRVIRFEGCSTKRLRNLIAIDFFPHIMPV